MNPESEDEDQGEDEDEDQGEDEDEENDNEDTNENLEESQLGGQDGSDEALLSSFQSMRMLHEMPNVFNVN